jgi:uncharacterized protein YndB with AHSA1/START domain
MKTILHLSDISASRANVFDALPSTTGLAGWWTTNVAGNAGADGLIDFTFEGSFNSDMRVIDFNPLSLVAWECASGHDNWAGSTFSFALEDRDGTRLRFRQDYSTELSDDDYAIYNYSWGYYLEGLRLYCETGNGKPFERSASQTT